MIHLLTFLFLLSSWLVTSTIIVLHYLFIWCTYNRLRFLHDYRGWAKEIRLQQEDVLTKERKKVCALHSRVKFCSLWLMQGRLEQADLYFPFYLYRVSQWRISALIGIDGWFRFTLPSSRSAKLTLKGTFRLCTLRESNTIYLFNQDSEEENSLYAFLGRIRLNIALDALRAVRCVARSTDRRRISQAMLHDAVIAHHRRHIIAEKSNKPAILKTYKPPLDDQVWIAFV